MALTINFNGLHILKPGYFGDPSPRAQWFNNHGRRELLQLLAKLGVRSALLYKREHRWPY